MIFGKFSFARNLAHKSNHGLGLFFILICRIRVYQSNQYKQFKGTLYFKFSITDLVIGNLSSKEMYVSDSDSFYGSCVSDSSAFFCFFFPNLWLVIQ